MSSFNNQTDFSHLLSYIEANNLLQHLTELTNHIQENTPASLIFKREEHLSEWKKEWQRLSSIKINDSAQQELDQNERAATDWLIKLFNILFDDQKVLLARSAGEPEYFPHQHNEPARIEFAHGFFASALHEMSHWCIAGKSRRALSDFGYWYAPDGRSADQQQAFERVEIKPQALECLFTLACGRAFQVSQDNLFAEFVTSSSTFASDVYLQAKEYITKPHTLPRDAKILLHTFLTVCASG
ncbi:elongation factor P hydroxylase [Psychrobacter vallis]|uniref:elongation factor P hydroxylase n=1 Tax=Psychrobacter vallis TaxID=248451 RepID=UPI00191940DE|nr:elongation factor P hydroxylase [Psychrobacter vallis]